MKLIDRQYLDTPFYGARKIAVWLKSKGFTVNRGADHLGPLTHAEEVNARIRAFLDAQGAHAPLARAA